jgi:prophage maintenance system killer protein
MTKLSKEQILMLHSMAIKQSGGLDGVRDDGLLDMALHAPFQTFESTELYPSIQSKAARLCFSIISHHPFIDGNKRIGILAMLVFLDNLSYLFLCNSHKNHLPVIIFISNSRQESGVYYQRHKLFYITYGVLIMKLLGIILGFIFPVFLIEAISLQKEDNAKASSIVHYLV